MVRSDIYLYLEEMHWTQFILHTLPLPIPEGLMSSPLIQLLCWNNISRSFHLIAVYDIGIQDYNSNIRLIGAIMMVRFSLFTCIHILLINNCDEPNSDCSKSIIELSALGGSLKIVFTFKYFARHLDIRNGIFKWHRYVSELK